jgi:branched-chain amino acid transport system ATP-binding protein
LSANGAAPTEEPLLEVKELSVDYAGVRALDRASLRVDRGAVVSVIGANGAGKTTLLRTVMGLVKNRSGEIRRGGVVINQLSAAGRVRGGMALVPEGRGSLPSMTVEENLLVGAFTVPKGSRDRLDALYQRLPTLDKLRRRPARVLSGGEQQLMAIGRAVMADPELILLDEPGMGLSPVAAKDVRALLHDLQAEGKTMLITEQDLVVSKQLASLAYVMRQGVISQLEEGALEQREALGRRYLGIDADTESGTH